MIQNIIVSPNFILWLVLSYLYVQELHWQEFKYLLRDSTSKLKGDLSSLSIFSTKNCFTYFRLHRMENFSSFGLFY